MTEKRERCFLKRCIYMAAAVFLIMAVGLAMTSCSKGDGDSRAADGGTAQSDPAAHGQDARDTQGSQTAQGAQDALGTASDEDVDVDLTKLSGTMLMPQIYDMMSKADDYIGAKVKMAGMFNVFTDENTGKQYFACLVSDSTGCCQEGFEFILEGEKKYPDDYPKQNTLIKITGTFETYTEGETKYCRLADAKLITG